MKQLIVAEKPSVARDIAKYVGANQRMDGYIKGDDFDVTWCIGHLVQLATPDVYGWDEWRWETLPMIPDDFKLQTNPSTVSQFKIVRALLQDQYDFVINACDAGREGEHIFRCVYELSKSTLPIKRLWIASLTKDAIMQGMQALKPGSEFDHLASAAKARSHADYLVGMNATRAVTLAVRQRNPNVKTPVFSVGRVQTPTLALLVKRHKDIEAFVPQTYYECHSEFTRDGQTYTGKFILGPKAVPTSGLRIVETAKIVHWDDPRLRIRDDKLLPLHEDEFGSRRVIKGFVEIDGLGIKLANGEVICRPDTSGKRLDGKWPLNLTGDLMTKTADGVDKSHVEDVKILKDQIKRVDGTTYRVPFEILLKSVPDKIIDNQRLVMRVEYPFEGSEKYGGPCGGGWAIEELEGLRIDPEPIEPKLTGKVTGKLNGTISQANTTVETKCLFPGLIFNNYNMELESTFENPQGELEYVDINLQVNESSHKLGVESFGEGKSPESISLTTHVSFVPTVDGKPSHLRSYSIPVQGQVEVRAYPRGLEPGWFAVKFNVRLKSDDPAAAPGEVELDFEIARYFDSHPCK